MAKQTNLLYAIMLLAVTLHSSRAEPNQTAVSDKRLLYCSRQDPGEIVRDVITLAMDEVHNTRKFISSIPHLKSMRDGDTPELHTCVGGLIDNLGDIHSTLKRVRHLKLPSICSDSSLLKGMMGPIVNFNNFCHLALSEIDSSITLTLKRKLVEVALMIDDVAFRVSQLKQDEPCSN